MSALPPHTPVLLVFRHPCGCLQGFDCGPSESEINQSRLTALHTGDRVEVLSLAEVRAKGYRLQPCDHGPCWQQCKDREDALRANLERLVARWKKENNRLRCCGGTATARNEYDAKANGILESKEELRRVLSGETPPEPGHEWEDGK